MAASNQGASSAASTEDREIVATRVFDAPRDLVFKMWTDPEHIAKWWGPNGFTTTISEMDIRPGGNWRFVMHGPDGIDYKNRIVYLEITKPERLVYKHSPERDTEPVNFQVTVNFFEEGKKTKLTVQMLFPSPATREFVIKKHSAVEGLSQTLGRLEKHLAEMLASNKPTRNFLITRTINAPRDLVFKAWTDPDHFKHWWGPKGWSVGIWKMDVRPGGTLLYDLHSPEGLEMWGKFVYREILPPDRLVFVNSFADENGNVVRAPFSPTWPLQVLNTVTFSEQFGQTILTLLGAPVDATAEEWHTFQSLFDSMHFGFSGTFDRLDGYLAKM
jgi:uncharacterized protein YndB with AHSA1/START domain